MSDLRVDSFSRGIESNNCLVGMSDCCMKQYIYCNRIVHRGAETVNQRGVIIPTLFILSIQRHLKFLPVIVFTVPNRHFVVRGW